MHIHKSKYKQDNCVWLWDFCFLWFGLHIAHSGIGHLYFFCVFYFPAEWRPGLGSRRRRRAHARKAREGNGNRSFPKRAFFSTIGQYQTQDAPKRYFYWSMKTLKPKRHLFGQSTRQNTFVAPTDIVNGQWKCLQTFVAPTDTIRHWPLKVGLSSTCLVVKSSIMTTSW